MLGGSEDDNSDDSDGSGDERDEGNASALDTMASSIAMSATKKRKISKNGFITSNSSKNHRTVDGRLDAVKRAKVELQGRDTSKTTAATGIFGLAKEVNGAGTKLKSIADVDRAMKSALAKRKRA